MSLYCAVSGMIHLQMTFFRNFGALVLMKRMKFTHLLERQHGAYMLLIPH